MSVTTRIAFAGCVALAMMAAPSSSEAQSVVVQGQVQVQPYGQPQGAPAVPPGYGTASGQVYVQPAQAPTYQAAPAQRQLRYVERQGSVTALWIPGIIVFGGAYVLTFTLSGLYSFDTDYQTWSYVPLVGPWVALGYANNDEEMTGAIIGGIAQAAGLAMFVLGLSLRRTVRVATYVLGDDSNAPELAFDLRPAAGGGQLGITLTHL